jgi:hypothetical protein
LGHGQRETPCKCSRRADCGTGRVLRLGQFKFRRRESREAAERYLTGLLIEHPNKNCDTLAAVVPGASQQQLPGLLTDMV